jgi:SAM-dependent methyltransferase
MLKTSIKAALRSLPPAILQDLIFLKLHAQNALSASKLKCGTDWVCSLGNFSAEQRVRYAEEVFNDYFSFSRFPLSALRGKRVLEIGTGENFSVGLLCLAHYAAKVVSIDRFPSLIGQEQQTLVYQALADKFSKKGIKTDRIMTFSKGTHHINPDYFEYLPHTAAEDLGNLRNDRFDIILSRAVLEHVYDIQLAFGSMDKLLAPGGCMIHEVDFRDHGIFSAFGLNPLTFLTYSSMAWNGATSRLGAPNRALENSFRDLLNRYGYQYEILKIHVIGSEKKFHVKELREGVTHDVRQAEFVRSIRNSLSESFKTLSDDDLLTAGIFFTAWKKSK